MDKKSGLRPMYGRDAELQQLKDAWADALEGNVRYVRIAGEPGTGKTRLVQAFYEYLTKEYDPPTEKFPEGYWPDPAEESDQTQWDETNSAFLSNLGSLRSIVKDPENDLYAPLPHAPNYTIFREILVVSDHNAYHIGEFAILRQVMGTW